MKTLSLILERPHSALARVSKTLGDADINIISIDGEEGELKSIMHVSVADKDFEAAHHVLREERFQVMPQEVLLIAVKDKPGELAKIAVLLSEANVNVRSMRIVKRHEGISICAIVPEPEDLAKAVLAEYTVIPSEDS